jgi:hypothetical protein
MTPSAHLLNLHVSGQAKLKIVKRFLSRVKAGSDLAKSIYYINFVVGLNEAFLNSYSQEKIAVIDMISTTGYVKFSPILNDEVLHQINHSESPSPSHNLPTFGIILEG